MGFRWEGSSLTDMFDPRPLDRAAGRIVERSGEMLHERVTEHTPVAQRPSGAGLEDWIDARGGREPGELKRSWKIGEVETIVETDPLPRSSLGRFVGRERMRVDVYTEDPVAPHVEWDTLPHLIRPRDPDGVLRFFDSLGDPVYARFINHPGTTGVHMMSTALQEVAAGWERIGREEVGRWSREQLRGLR